MISKEIEVSVTKKSLKKLRLNCREYEWKDSGVSKGIIDPLLSTSYSKASNHLQGLAFQT